MMLMGTLGDRLKEARIKAGISQEKLADLIGEQRTNYNRFENGARKSITPEKLEKASDALGIPLNQLKSWQALDDYDIEVLKLAVAEASKIRSQRGS